MYIGNQSRPEIFELDIRVPEMLYEEVIEVNERVVLEDRTCIMGVKGKREHTKNEEQV